MEQNRLTVSVKTFSDVTLRKPNPSWWKKERGIYYFMQLRNPGMELASGFWVHWASPALSSVLLYLPAGSFAGSSCSLMATAKALD